MPVHLFKKSESKSNLELVFGLNPIPVPVTGSNCFRLSNSASPRITCMAAPMNSMVCSRCASV
ncbi:hypothetical protein D3C71_2052210 [compost metagenome]